MQLIMLFFSCTLPERKKYETQKPTYKFTAALPVLKKVSIVKKLMDPENPPLRSRIQGTINL